LDRSSLLARTAARHLQLTDEGQEAYRRIRSRVDETIGQLYADIPATDLATAGRVLTLITARANAELASGS
jgi:DNA-binding MarR family transcriptional regulator